jgi:hypothetical protein
MKVAIMQPYFCPYIGYWQLINSVNTFVIYDDVNYIKGGWINRNYFLINNEPKLITLQLGDSSPNKLINEISIVNNDGYNKKILRTIEMNYKYAPYFNDVYTIFKEIILYPEHNLSKFLENSIRKISKYLEIETEIIVSSKITKESCLKGQDRVINICQILGAKEYINAIGGQELYSKSIFMKNNLKLSFIQSLPLKYSQFNDLFHPNLSIIDLMMFNSVSELKKILFNYVLI